MSVLTESGNIAIRVDGSTEIGLGHIYRCVCLASNIRRFGLRVTFLTRDTNPMAQDLIESSGHELINLETVDKNKEFGSLYEKWLGVTELEDANQCRPLIESLRPSLVIVDHYGISSKWAEIAIPRNVPLCVIDDLANRNVSCSILIDHNVNRKALDYEPFINSAETALCIGPRFAILRRGFLEKRANYLKKPGVGSDSVMISFGGSDLENATCAVLRELERGENSTQLSLKVIIGRSYMHEDELAILVKKSRHQIEVVKDTDEMDALLQNISFSIGAAGTSLLERTCACVPTIIVTVADNQIEIAKHFDSAGFGSYLGDIRGSEWKNLLGAAVEGLMDPDKLHEQRSILSGLVDGKGANRISFKLLGFLGFEVAFDLVTTNDYNFIYDCRYVGVESSNYLNSKIPCLSEHLHWVSRAVGDEGLLLYVARLGKERIGHVRFDKNGASYEVSIYLKAEFRECGIGDLVLASACKAVSAEAVEVTAHVKKSNLASLNTFLKVGFEIVGEEVDFLRLVKNE